MKRDNTGRRPFWRNPRFRYGSLSALILCVFLAALVAFSLTMDSLEKKNGWRVDYSFNGVTTQSDATLKVLAELPHPVHIYALFSRGQEDAPLMELLNRYAAASPLVTWEQTDVGLNPGLLTRFHTEGSGESVSNDSLIVFCEATGRWKVLSRGDFISLGLNLEKGAYEIAGLTYEGQITSALRYVTQEKIPRIMVLQDHGELDAEATAVLAELWQGNNYEVQYFSLRDGSAELTPEDMLAILSPVKDLTAEELAAISEYAMQGGSILFTCDFTDPVEKMPNYQALLRSYGFLPKNGLVVASKDEPESYYNRQIYIIPAMQSTDVTLDLVLTGNDVVLMPGSRAFELPGEGDRALDTRAVLTTGYKSYLKVLTDADYSLEQTGEDELGPFALALQAQRVTEEGNISRAFVLGCSTLLTDTQVHAMTNAQEFILRATEYLLNTTPVDLDIMAKAALRPQLSVESVTLGSLLLAVLPLSVLAAALIVLLPAAGAEQERKCMQKVEKKNRPARARSRWLLLGVAAAVLAVCCGVYAWASRPAPINLDDYVSTDGELITRDAADVARLRVALRSGDSWSAAQTEPGILTVEGEDAFQASSALTAPLLDAARIIAYEDVFTDDPALYRDRLDEFGLETPRAVAEILYTDGTVCTLRLGDPCKAEEGRVYYMTVDGDDRLFALDRGTAEILATERALLYPVTQPTLHKARFDRITFTGADGAVQAEWALQGGIGGNAADRWLLTEPVRYPADGDSMTSLLGNLANLRLGAYVGEATPENLTRCGFDNPRFTLTIHQAAGTIGTTDAEGRYGTTDWPESAVTFVVGGAKNDSVDYVLVEGNIYISSHYSLQTLMDMDPQSTVSRYPAPVALGNLASLTVEKDGSRANYVLTRESKTGGDAIPEEDDASPAVEVTCTLNGTEIPYAGFEAAYNRLLTATVSGRLPAGWSAAEDPHTVFTFEDITGATHTVSLTQFDALHDAVAVDGYAMFYMIRGGFEIGLPGA